MTDDIIPKKFDGFIYAGHEIKLFSKAYNHFQLLLHNGNTFSFEPPIEHAEDFKEWLLRNNVADVKSR